MITLIVLFYIYYIIACININKLSKPNQFNPFNGNIFEYMTCLIGSIGLTIGFITLCIKYLP